MITEDFCSFEIAKLLKEKGFDVEVGGMYVDKDNNFVHASLAPLKVKDYEKVFDDQFIPTCTHQMAMKWLREKGVYLNIRIALNRMEDDVINNIHWVVDILDFSSGEWKDNDIWADTYEEAVEAALKFSLENLI